MVQPLKDHLSDWHNLYPHLPPEDRRSLYRQAKRRLFLARHNHQLILLAASLLSLAANPGLSILILPPAWIGLLHRQRLSLPTLRLLTAIVVSLAISVSITIQIAPTRPLAAIILTPMLTALFTTIALTAAYLLRSALPLSSRKGFS